MGDYWKSDSMTRSELSDKLEALGAKVGSSVSKNVDILVVGSNPGSKLKKAETLEFVVSENELSEFVTTFILQTMCSERQK